MVDYIAEIKAKADARAKVEGEKSKEDRRNNRGRNPPKTSGQISNASIPTRRFSNAGIPDNPLALRQTSPNTRTTIDNSTEAKGTGNNPNPTTQTAQDMLKGFSYNEELEKVAGNKGAGSGGRRARFDSGDSRNGVSSSSDINNPNQRTTNVYGIPALQLSSEADKAAREESLRKAGQGEPEQMDFFEKLEGDEASASANVGPEISDAFTGQSKLKKDSGAESGIENDTRSAEEIQADKEDEKKYGKDLEEVDSDQFEMPLDIAEGYDMDRLGRVRRRLNSEMKISLTINETNRLTKMNFKKKPPLGMFAIAASDFFLEIVSSMTSLFFSVIGMSSKLLTTFLLPVIGLFLSGSVTTIGFIIGIMSIVASVMLTILFITVMFYYQRHCCEIMQIPAIRKAAIGSYVWIWAFSMFVPFLGSISQILRCVLVPHHLSKMIKQIEKIVKSP